MKSVTSYLPVLRKRCVDAYRKIVSKNPNIDAGHSVGHVVQVADLVRKHLRLYLQDLKTDRASFRGWINVKYGGDERALDVPEDVDVRTEIGALLHEIGDDKFEDGKVKKLKSILINEVLDEVLEGYPWDSDEMRCDIINMVEWAGAAAWGDIIPPGSKIYHLIVRGCDRLEAVGPIGLARTLTFTHSFSKKRIAQGKAPYPLVIPYDDEDQTGDYDNGHFCSTMDDLFKWAPYKRWMDYSATDQDGNPKLDALGKRVPTKPSISTLGHLGEKIVWLDGRHVPIKSIREDLDAGQAFVREFLLDLNNKFNRQFPIEYIISLLDPKLYETEIKQLRQMREEYLAEGNPWIQ